MTVHSFYMSPLGKRLRAIFSAEEPLLWLLTGATALVLFVACALKYSLFLYNGIDLAYFNQVLWNTVHGRPFLQSIHPHLSLGDHAEFILLLLALPYAIIRHPLTLLALQAIAVTTPALVIYRIAIARYGAKPPFGAAPFFIALAWLANSSIQNMTLFEFHALPFALLPLLLALLAYERGSLKTFILWSLTALLVREDVALVIMMIGALAWIEKKPLIWRIVPATLGITWFVTAMAVISKFAPVHGYKFATYYTWLGTTPAEIFHNIITHPLAVISHFVSLGNLDMILALLMPVAFLPFLAPRRLLLLLGPLAIMTLGAPGGSNMVAVTHYATLFLPALFLATIDGLSKAPSLAKKLENRYGGEEWRLVPALAILLCSVYSLLILGPLPHVFTTMFDREAWRRSAAANDALKTIAPTDSVAAGYALLPALSSRSSLYSAHYIFLGVTQFAELPYPPPPDLRKTVLEQNDFLKYSAQFPSTNWTAPRYADGHTRLSLAIGPTVYESGDFAVHDLDAVPLESSIRVPIDRSQGVVWREREPIRFLRTSAWKDEKNDVIHLRVDVTVAAPTSADRSALRFVVLGKDHDIITTDIRPIVMLSPIPNKEDRLQLSYDIRLPKNASPSTIKTTLVTESAIFSLDRIGTSARDVRKTTVLDTVDLPLSP